MSKEEMKETEEIKEEIKEEINEEAEVKEAAQEATEDVKEEAAQLSSTEAKRKKKADRREAKAARKEANKVEEKKTRPNNAVLAILIFGVLVGMFVFVGAYNYFSKPANIEKYITDNGFADMYKDAPVSDHTTMTMKADKNTLKIWLKVDEDAPKEETEQYTGEEGTKLLKQWGAYYLTSMKPSTRGLSGKVKVKAKQGDESLNYVELTYSEAKKFIKEMEKEAEEEAEEASGDADEAEEAAEAADEAAGDTGADDAEAESDGE